MCAGAGEDGGKRSGRLFRHRLVQPVDGWSISGILDLALVRQRGSNCGYSDFTVAAVEIRLVAAALVVELRRIVLGHFLLRGNLHFGGFVAFPWRPGGRATQAEKREKSGPLVP